jgi:DMSO/TMAO reductase YedYZ molybdopterin-dependent catalytic subunit
VTTATEREPTAGTRRARTGWSGRLAAALAGLLAAAVALGVAELLASVFGASSSPAVAVGQAVIAATPEPVKEFAISTFGENDKTALLVGTYGLLLAFALLLGVSSLRRVAYGVAGIALFGVVGMAAAVTRHQAGPFAALPSLVGAFAGIVVLLLLIPAVVAAWPAHPVSEGPSADEDAEEERREVGRRRFLRVAVLAGVTAAATGAVGRFLVSRRSVREARSALRLPAPARPAPALPAGTELKVPGVTPFFTSAADFYRVDTALVLPQVDPETWVLRIHGRVGRVREITFAELLRRPMIERDVTLACVSNEVGGGLNGTARWLGVPLADLLAEVEPEPGADQIVTTSADGWTCGTPTALCRDGRDAMLAVAMNGEPLPVEHGFPVRMIVPGLYGYVSATKWIVDMRLTTFDDVDAYWVTRGWSQQATIKTFSRIDVPKPFGRPAAGRVAVAGIAYAQHRGIAGVEVRVDGGDWRDARLAGAPASDDTWRQWAWEWDATRGQHTLECRATDKTGATQPEKRRKPFPDGATGWHSVVVTVT